MVRIRIRVILIFFHAKDLFVVGVEPVETQFMLYPQHDEQNTGHTDGKAQEINNGDVPVFKKQPDGKDNIVTDH
jgi:hypothetical protein